MSKKATNEILRMVNEITKYSPEGEAFFDALDEQLSSTSNRWLITDAINLDPKTHTLILSGGFGKTVSDLIDAGWLPKRNYVLFKELQNEYNELIKTSTEEFNRIITEVLPMESGFAFKIKTYPMPTIEQAESAKQLIESLRGEASRKREELQRQRNSEVEEKIKSLGELIGTKDYSKKTTKDAKWVIEARSHSRLNESLTAGSFWRDSHQVINTIAKWVLERKEIEHKNKQAQTKTTEAVWCKQYLIEHTSLEEKLLSAMSQESIIELAHQHLKTEFSKANEITGEKCYCESHDEMRHYHYAETYWNGTEVQVYETSETY